MKHKDLPQRWRDRIEHYVKENGSKYKQLSAYDFSPNRNLKISFEDGSSAFFKYAFYWTDAEAKEVAVFTEHCGYHIFNFPELLLETTDWERKTIKIEDYRTE